MIISLHLLLLQIQVYAFLYLIPFTIYFMQGPESKSSITEHTIKKVSCKSVLEQWHLRRGTKGENAPSHFSGRGIAALLFKICKKQQKWYSKKNKDEALEVGGKTLLK